MRAVIDGSYQPLSRPLFIYVSDKSAQRPEVRQVHRVLPDRKGRRSRPTWGFVPLPEQAAKTALQHFTDEPLGHGVRRRARSRASPSMSC